MQTLQFLGGLDVDGTEGREAAAASGLEPHPVRVQERSAYVSATRRLAKEGLRTTAHPDRAQGVCGH